MASSGRVITKRRHTLLGTGFGLLLLGGLVGCSAPLPSWDTVRQEARDATEEVVALLPAATEVTDVSTETPFGCQSAGVIYTARLAAYPGADFDGEGFIAALPDELRDDWVVDSSMIQTATPRVSFDADGISLTVAFVDDDGRPAFDIQALSRCGEDPGIDGSR